MTTITVSKFHQNPRRSVKWFLHNSLHIYRELLLSHQVLDQKYFAAPKKLNTFSLVTMLTLDGFSRQSETISVTPRKSSGILERT